MRYVNFGKSAIHSNKRELLDVENNLENSQSDNKQQRNPEGNKSLVTSFGLFRQSKRLTRDHEYDPRIGVQRMLTA